MPVGLSYKPMIEAIIFFWKHCVLERPKQLEIGGKENYCRILLFKNAQYGKDSQKENWYGRFSWKKSAKEFVFSKLQIYSIYFTNRGLLFQRFLWNTLKLLVLILFRTSLAATICAEKHARSRVIITYLPVRSWKHYYLCENFTGSLP